jgi:hypothetical protein
MGADLIVAGVVIPKGKEPDWETAAGWVEALDAEDLSTIAGNLGWEGAFVDEDDRELAAQQTRTDLLEVLARFREAVEGGLRDVAEFELLGHRVIFSGGMSTGDSPTDSCDAISDAMTAGLDDAAGFGEQIPVVVTCRHPDYSNEHHVFGQVEMVDVDYGSSFDGRPDDYETAIEWASSHWATAASLPAEPRALVESWMSDLLAEVSRYTAEYDFGAVTLGRPFRVKDAATGEWVGNFHYAATAEAAGEISEFEQARDVRAELEAAAAAMVPT